MLVGNFVMSANALQSTPHNLILALLLGVVLTLVSVGSVRAQDQPVPPGELADILTRVRESAPGGVTPLNAISVGQRLLAQQRYGEADELFKALLEKLPYDPAVLYGAALARFNLNKAAEAEVLVRAAIDVLLAKGPDASKSLERRRRGADALVLLAIFWEAAAQIQRLWQRLSGPSILYPNTLTLSSPWDEPSLVWVNLRMPHRLFALLLSLNRTTRRRFFFWLRHWKLQAILLRPRKPTRNSSPGTRTPPRVTLAWGHYC